MFIKKSFNSIRMIQNGVKAMLLSIVMIIVIDGQYPRSIVTIESFNHWCLSLLGIMFGYALWWEYRIMAKEAGQKQPIDKHTASAGDRIKQIDTRIKTKD